MQEQIFFRVTKAMLAETVKKIKNYNAKNDILLLWQPAFVLTVAIRLSVLNI